MKIWKTCPKSQVLFSFLLFFASFFLLQLYDMNSKVVLDDRASFLGEYTQHTVERTPLSGTLVPHQHPHAVYYCHSASSITGDRDSSHDILVLCCTVRDYRNEKLCCYASFTSDYN